MATAAISTEYVEDAKDFAAELDENGYLASFGTYAKPINNWDPPGEYAEAGKVSVFPSNWDANFSSDVRADDLMFFVTPMLHVNGGTELLPLGEWRAGVDAYGGSGFYLDADSGIPDYTHMIDSDGRKLQIINANQFKPDGVTVIYYEIQCR